MSGNYTYGEIMKMQEKAAQSAMEMNSRATACRDCSSESDSTDRISDFHKEPADKICSCSECKNRKCKNNPEFHPEDKNNFSLFQDNDKMLIMALILILSKNSDDKLLLFALMYIMM